MGKPPTSAPDTWRDIANRYRSGESIESIAKAVGYSSSGVAKVLHRDPTITVRPRQAEALDAIDQLRAVAIYEAGSSARATAARMGVSATYIVTLLRRHGVPVRPRIRRRRNVYR